MWPVGLFFGAYWDSEPILIKHFYIIARHLHYSEWSFSIVGYRLCNSDKHYTHINLSVLNSLRRQVKNLFELFFTDLHIYKYF